MDTKLAGKADSGHGHAAEEITSGTLSSDRLPTVPIAKGGTGATTAAAALTNLGAAAASHTHTPASIGAATASHSHSAADITSGTLAVARGGTGVTSLDALVTTMGVSKIQTGSYTGSGTCGSGSPNRLTFNFVPKLVIVLMNGSRNMTYGRSGFFLWLLGGVIIDSNVAADVLTASLSSKTLSWYQGNGAQQQYNVSGTVYNYIAFG